MRIFHPNNGVNTRSYSYADLANAINIYTAEVLGGVSMAGMTRMTAISRKNIGDPHGDPADGQRIIKSVFLQIL